MICLRFTIQFSSVFVKIFSQSLNLSTIQKYTLHHHHFTFNKSAAYKSLFKRITILLMNAKSFLNQAKDMTARVFAQLA